MTPIAAPHGGVPPLGVSRATASGSSAQVSNSRIITRPAGCATRRVRNQIIMEATEPIPKKQRSSTSAGSLGSSLTHVDTQGQADAEKFPEFEKFIAAQKEFWDTCTLSFLFEMQTFLMHILQCKIANDKYIIWKMVSEIVKSVKVELVQMGDINQR